MEIHEPTVVGLVATPDRIFHWSDRRSYARTAPDGSNRRLVDMKGCPPVLRRSPQRLVALPARRHHDEQQRRFEEAQRTDMESFRDFDRETWRNVHTEDAVSIFPSGAVVQGRDAIVDALASHFDDEEAIFTWTERLRTVNRCRTAYILYDTVYEILDRLPAGGEDRCLVHVRGWALARRR